MSISEQDTMCGDATSALEVHIQSNMSMHHYECIALCFVNILQ